MRDLSCMSVVLGVATQYNHNTGRAYLFNGGDPFDTTADVVFDGENPDDRFGRQATMGPDVDGDGYGEILIEESHWGPSLEKFRLDLSYLAFSNCSTNDDFGNGDPNSGETAGWINRGLDWEDIADTPDQYAVSVLAYYQGLQYPLTVDVTPRRLQRFTVHSGQEVLVRPDNAESQKIKADDHGLITIHGVIILDRRGTRIWIKAL